MTFRYSAISIKYKKYVFLLQLMKIIFSVVFSVQQQSTYSFWFQYILKKMETKEGQNNTQTIQGCTSDEQQPTQRVPGLTGKKEWPIRILSFLFFAGTVAIVYVFGQDNNQVSDKYILYVTPPGLFFLIWAAIFVLKGIANIVNLVLNIWTLKAHIFLAINNIFLILWTFIFNIGNDPAVYVSFLLIFSLIPSTLLFWYQIGKIKPINWFTYFTRNSYAFYLGWVVAATNINLGIIIVYWWKASFLTQLIIFWIMAPLSALFLTGLNVFNEGLFGLKGCLALWISVTWAFVGAGISSNQSLIG